MKLKLLENLKTLAALNLPLLALLSGLLINPLSSCKTPDDRQGFVPTIYAGDSQLAAVVRSQSAEVIPANDKRFDEMFCMFDRDLEKLFQACLDQTEAEKSWYYFGHKKAGGLSVKKPDDNESGEDEETVKPAPTKKGLGNDSSAPTADNIDGKKTPDKP